MLMCFLCFLLPLIDLLVPGSREYFDHDESGKEEEEEEETNRFTGGRGESSYGRTSVK